MCTKVSFKEIEFESIEEINEYLHRLLEQGLLSVKIVEEYMKNKAADKPPAIMVTEKTNSSVYSLTTFDKNTD